MSLSLSGRNLLVAGTRLLSALPVGASRNEVGAHARNATVLQGVGASTAGLQATRNLQKFFIKLTIFLFVLIPTLIVGAYMGFLASDQYIVETRFSSRSNEQRGMFEGIGMLTGLPSVSGSADSNLLVDFVRSPDLVAQIDKELGLHKIFSAKGDWYYRMASDAQLEDIVKYWREVVHVRTENASQSVVISVRAFSPKDAKLIADSITEKCARLVNELSERAREETLAVARKDVKLAEDRLQKAREDTRVYRDQSRVLDPRGSVEARSKMIGQMEVEISGLRSQLIALRSSLSETAPSVVALKTRISAIETELEKVRTNADDTSRKSANLPSVIKNFENLQTEAMFAEKAYLASMAALERARADADRNSKYLAVHVKPIEPQSSQQPKRFMLTLSTLVICFMTWGCGWLVFLGIRDHMH